MDHYEDKLRRERAWYRPGAFASKHVLNAWPVYSAKRAVFTVCDSKAQFARYVRQVLEREDLANPRMLIAPTGAGHDLPYLLPLSERVSGIDISEDALRAFPDKRIEKHLGDIRRMTMFEDGRFDAVIMSAFFHHFVGFGFDDFLREAWRVLRPGGHLFSYEPSILHPAAAAAWCAKKVFGNFAGQVEDESPFYPGRLTRAMKRCGFMEVTFGAVSYSHHCLPIPLAYFIQKVGYPLLRAPLLKYFGYWCVFSGRKK